jgi:hypothetical protein
MSFIHIVIELIWPQCHSPFQRLAVGILVSGFAFDEEDYIRPWEGWKDNLERSRIIFGVLFFQIIIAVLHPHV